MLKSERSLERMACFLGEVIWRLRVRLACCNAIPVLNAVANSGKLL